MPTSQTPASENERESVQPEEGGAPAAPPAQQGGGNGPLSTSRWVDYGTHELLEMISELEDERRWARLREGILWAVLAHIFLLSAVTWIPKYVLRQPRIIDPFEEIQKRKDLSYLDLPPDVLERYKPKVEVKPVPKKSPQIDRKTLEEMRKTAPPEPQQTLPETRAPEPAPAQQTPAPQQAQSEAPRPQAVPARPNFAMGSQNPNEQLRQALRGATRSPGYGTQLPSGTGDMQRHPGAGAGGVQVLSDTQGVDFSSWLQRWYHETERTWDPLIPDEVNPPISKSGAVQIRFRVGPNGRLIEGSMVLEGRSGDTGLDRAAWGALTGSNYPPLPHDFHGPYLELRAVFMYNMQPR